MWQNIKRHHPAFLRNDAFIFCHGSPTNGDFRRHSNLLFFILYYGMTHRRHPEARSNEAIQKKHKYFFEKTFYLICNLFFMMLYYLQSCI